MFIGIDDNAGLLYEGTGSTPDRPVLPTPTISQAGLIESPIDWNLLPSGFRSNPQTWLFREDSFDAVTRTRRGRLYQAMQGASYPQHNMRVLPHPIEYPTGVASSDGRTTRPLHVYAAGTALLELAGRGVGRKLAVGNARSASAWRIVQTEVTLYDDIMLTLKALTAYGVIPEIEHERIPAQFRSDVDQALERAVNSAFRETGESVVDQCRNALTVVLSRWLVGTGADARILKMDLSELAKHVLLADMRCASWISSVVATLHSRGKMNEAKSLRRVTEDDAEMTIQMLGFALREIGWAK